MPEVRRGDTWVVVQMRPEGADRTRVTVTHLGWKDGPEWDRAFQHFIRGWSDLMARFESRFAEGPIDWRKEVETRDKEHFSLKERAISR